MTTSSPLIIGVAGGSGSGKTTVAQQIIRALGHEQVTFIQHDSYYRDRSGVPPEERKRINYDHPDALETELLVEHLEALKAGRPVEVPVYDFTDHVRIGAVTAEPLRVVVVEGLLALSEPALRALMDLKVFVDTDADLRIIRRIDRDLRERGRDLDWVVRQYLQTVRPMHLEFVEPSKRHADVIILDGGYNRDAVEMLVARVLKMVG
jgi:uridine kinase